MATKHIPVSLGQVGSIRLFAGLPEESLKVLAAASTERRYEKDEVVFLKGDPSSGLFAVASGRVKMVCQGPSGEEKVIDVRGAREVFGEEGLLHDLPYGYMVSALSNTCLLHLDRQSLQDLFDTSSRFALQMLAHMSHRVFAGMRDIEDFRTRAPLERLAGFLLDQCALVRHLQPKVNLLAPKHVIASRLGMTPESFSRCLRDMAEDRILASRGAVITILDRERLGALVA